MNHRKLLLALCLGGAVISPIAAIAQSQRPPRPDFGAFASEFGIPEDALAACMEASVESGEGRASSNHPPRPNAVTVADCLTESGYTVSVVELDEAIKAAAPPRRG